MTPIEAAKRALRRAEAEGRVRLHRIEDDTDPAPRKSGRSMKGVEINGRSFRSLRAAARSMKTNHYQLTRMIELGKVEVR